MALFPLRYGVLWAVLALILAAARDLRRALLYTLILLYVCGYVSLCFEHRHGFHLAFVSPLLLCILCNSAWIWLRLRAASAPSDSQNDRPAAVPPWFARSNVVRATVAYAGVLVAVLVIPHGLAIAYQYVHVGAMYEKYRAAQLTPLLTTQVELEDNVLFRLSPDDPLMKGSLSSDLVDDYLMVRLNGHDDEIGMAYEGALRDETFCYSYDVYVRSKAHGDKEAVCDYFFPVYMPGACQTSMGHWARFAGVILPKEQACRFMGLYRVNNREDFRLFLHMSIPRDRAAFSRLQTFDATAGKCVISSRRLSSSLGKRVEEGVKMEAAGDRNVAIALYRQILAQDNQNLYAWAALREALAHSNSRDAVGALDEEIAAIAPNFSACLQGGDRRKSR